MSQQTFDAAQAKLAKNKKNTAPKTVAKYLFSGTGLLRCGDCGESMGAHKNSGPVFYRCRTYHTTGASACHCNSIAERPLVDVIITKIQSRYLSEPALARLRKVLEKEQARNRPRPQDLSRLKREIEQLNRRIDNGQDSVLEAPAKLRPGLYDKLNDLIQQRDGLNQDLNALTRVETRSKGKGGSDEIDRAIKALRDLHKAFKRAKPEDTRELLQAVCSKIELHFTHTQRAKREKTEFAYGIIHLRPDLAGGWGSVSSHSNTCRQ